jgi:DNA helicase-2/ATP-dependent DNA helicase PcrA
MTRAREELYLTSALDYGGKRQRKVSQFVLEALDLPKADISLIKRSPREQIELFASAEISLPAGRKMKKDELLYLSFSQVEDYLLCPLKYKYVHVLRVPLLPSHLILYGKVMHKAAQVYSQARMKKRKFSQQDLLRVLLNGWSSEGFISRQHEEQRLAQAKKTLKKFFKDQQRSKRKIKYVEEEFSIPKDNVVIRGRWDRVDEVAGKVHIVDFKTSEVKKQADADRRAKQSRQLGIYAAVWQERFGSLPERVELYYLESGLIGSVKIGEEAVKKTWDMLREVSVKIRKAEYAAKPSYRACSYCAYNEICPASAV